MNDTSLKGKAASLIQDKNNRVKLICFFLIFLLNLLTVKTSDDLGYSINHGLIDIFQREYVQYMSWTGRSVAHIIARVFLAMPKGIFNLFNSILFCLQAELIGKFAVGKNERVSGLLYALIALTVFLGVPVFGQTVLWETGSCNYLWTTMIILAFLYQYRKQLDEPTDKNVVHTLLFFLFGIAAGWTNENTGGACILMVLAFLALCLKQKQKLKPWMIAGLFGSVIGFVIMIKAPGNAIRSADFINEGGKAYVLVHDLINTLEVFSGTSTQLWLWLAFGISVAIALITSHRKNLLSGICFALSGMAAVMAIIISPVPVYFDRSMYGATIFIIIGIVVVLKESMTEKAVKTGAVITLSGLTVLSVFRYGRALVDLGYTRYQFQNRETWVAQQKQQGNLNPVIPVINNEFFTTYNAMYGLNDILTDPGFVNNENYALTHGLESVISTSQEKWNNLYRYGDPQLMNLLDMETYFNYLKDHPEYSCVINCSTLDGRYEPYLEILTSFTGDTKLKQAVNLIIIAEDGNQKIFVNEDAQGMEYYLGSHYVWVSSHDDPALSDIVIDGIEYTNDIEGITVTVFDREKDRAVDTVTWNPDYGTRGLRYYTGG